MNSKFFIKCTALLFAGLMMLGVCGCSKTPYTPIEMREKGKNLLNYTYDGQHYIDYAVTYETSYQGTTTSKVIVSGVMDGKHGTVSLSDETNAIVKTYNELAVMNDNILYLNADPILNLLEDKDIFVSTSPDYYSKKVVAVELAPVMEKLTKIIADVQSAVTESLTAAKDNTVTADEGKVLALEYTAEEWKALLSSMLGNLEKCQSEIFENWTACKDTVLSETFGARWNETIEMDENEIFRLPPKVSVYDIIHNFLEDLANTSTEREYSAVEKLRVYRSGGGYDFQCRWLLTSADGDTAASLLLSASERNGTISIPEYSSDRTATLDDFSNHVFDELRDILTGNYEDSDIFDKIEVVGNSLHVHTHDDAADIEYVFNYSSDGITGCEVLADVYDIKMMNALRSHYASKKFTLIENDSADLEKGISKGRLVVRSDDDWAVPTNIAGAMTPAELSTIIKKDGLPI